MHAQGEDIRLGKSGDHVPQASGGTFQKVRFFHQTNVVEGDDDDLQKIFDPEDRHGLKVALHFVHGDSYVTAAQAEVRMDMFAKVPPGTPITPANRKSLGWDRLRRMTDRGVVPVKILKLMFTNKLYADKVSREVVFEKELTKLHPDKYFLVQEGCVVLWHIDMIGPDVDPDLLKEPPLDWDQYVRVCAEELRKKQHAAELGAGAKEQEAAASVDLFCMDESTVTVSTTSIIDQLIAESGSKKGHKKRHCVQVLHYRRLRGDRWRGCLAAKGASVHKGR